MIHVRTTQSRRMRDGSPWIILKRHAGPSTLKSIRRLATFKEVDQEKTRSILFSPDSINRKARRSSSDFHRDESGMSWPQPQVRARTWNPWSEAFSLTPCWRSLTNTPLERLYFSHTTTEMYSLKSNPAFRFPHQFPSRPCAIDCWK